MKINLNDIELYTQLSFESIQKERFSQKFNFFVCKIKGEKKTYYFDASKFIEDCLRNEKIVNPLTRERVKKFTIYISTIEAPDFQKYMDEKEVLQFPNYFVLFWNDTDKSLLSRLAFKVHYANYLEKTDLKRSLHLYKEAALQGSVDAKAKLGLWLIRLGENEEALKWLEQLQNSELSIKNLFRCVQGLDNIRAFKLAFQLLLKAAEKNELPALVEVIDRLENGKQGIEKDLVEAQKWRARLPLAWGESSLGELINFVSVQRQI